MFEGMSAEAVSRLVREPVYAPGRAGFWGLDTAAPLVAGTYVAARAAVDVALTATDLVLGGATARTGCAGRPVITPPLDVRRLLLLQPLVRDPSIGTRRLLGSFAAPLVAGTTSPRAPPSTSR